MMEQRQIVRLWQQGGATVLVTLVRAEGSSYRRPGARLLLTAKGEHAGTISGGCLEVDVLRRAEWLIREGATVERYTTSFDDTSEVPFGLGCGGTLDLLLEPATTAEARALLEATEEALQGERRVVVTYLPGDGRSLRRVVLDASGIVIFASDGLSDSKIACAQGLQPGQDYEGRFVEELKPPQRLFVLGAGDDARPIVSMAALLGWTATVADGRAQLARAERFPQAAGVVALRGIDGLAIGADDAVVIMTHSYEQDRDLLAALLPLRPRYLGLLGARHRSSLLVNEVAVQLGWEVAACCERIYAPVGLDLGGDGSEAIALAVIAEVQACCQGKVGASRRLTAADVAELVARGGASSYLQMQCSL